jgi:hypothetical protein
MLNEIRRIFSRSTPAEIAEAILGAACLCALLVLFLIVTP